MAASSAAAIVWRKLAIMWRRGENGGGWRRNGAHLASARRNIGGIGGSGGVKSAGGIIHQRHHQ